MNIVSLLDDERVTEKTFPKEGPSLKSTNTSNISPAKQVMIFPWIASFTCKWKPLRTLFLIKICMILLVESLPIHQIGILKDFAKITSSITDNFCFNFKSVRTAYLFKYGHNNNL